MPEPCGPYRIVVGEIIERLFQTHLDSNQF